MYTKEMYVTRIKFIALSQIRQILDALKDSPADYRQDTREYLEAMYFIIDTMDDDGYVADSLMAIAQAQYQNELGERNVYDMGWDRLVEDFFRTAIA